MSLSLSLALCDWTAGHTQQHMELSEGLNSTCLGDSGLVSSKSFQDFPSPGVRLQSRRCLANSTSGCCLFLPEISHSVVSHLLTTQPHHGVRLETCDPKKERERERESG